MLYADHLVLMVEIIEEVSKFQIWKKAFESDSLKVSHWKTKVMFSGDIVEDGMFISKVCTCVICSLMVKGKLVLCVKCK